MFSDQTERTPKKETEKSAVAEIERATKVTSVTSTPAQLVDDGLVGQVITGAQHSKVRSEESTTPAGLGAGNVHDVPTPSPDADRKNQDGFEKMLAYLDDEKCAEIEREVERQLAEEAGSPPAPFAFDGKDPFGLNWEWASPDGSDPDEEDDEEIESEQPKSK